MKRTRAISLLAVVAFLLTTLLAPVHAVSTSAARQLGSSVADAVERVMPSVVVVRTEATVYRAARDLFFGRVYGIPERLAGQGSGVIISRDGFVLTSDHVIRNAQVVEVVLDSGEKYPAELVGRDPQTDLAVLKIRPETPTEFTPAEAGDSDKVRIGEFAIAIGSPFSLNSSVTLGIVSQKGRSVGMLPYEDFIQTDASINPGNSGGPLIDIDGKLIGINAMIQTGPNAGGNIGIGFAVPVNLAMSVAESLMKSGKVERPWLGLRLQEFPSQSRGASEGVLVDEVFGNTPAARSGLRGGDVIVSVDDQPVEDIRAVQRIILRHKVGDAVKLGITRSGQRLAVEITADRMPDFSEFMR